MFKNEQTLALFRPHFCADLRDVLSRLHNRDERNKLFAPDFWIIDKKLADGVEHVQLHKVVKLVSPTLIKNCPQVYAFEIRAKVF